MTEEEKKNFAEKRASNIIADRHQPLAKRKCQCMNLVTSFDYPAQRAICLFDESNQINSSHKICWRMSFDNMTTFLRENLKAIHRVVY